MRDADLVLDALLVRIDRLGVDGQLFTDLRRRVSLGDEAQHVALALSQALEAIDISLVRNAAQRSGEDSRGRRAHEHVAARNRADGRHELPISRVLAEETR